MYEEDKTLVGDASRCSFSQFECNLSAWHKYECK